jgi:hypothetical protein
LVSSSLLAAACGGEPTPTPEPVGGTSRLSLESIIPDTYSLGIRGVAVDQTNGDLTVLAPGYGLVELTKDGDHVRTILDGEDGLYTGGASDVGKLEDGRYVLATFGDVFRYDPNAKTQESFFCLVPAIQDSWMENDAITVVGSADRILAAPAYYELDKEGPQSSFHVSYTENTGEFIDQTDVRASGFVARGIAFDTAEQRVLAVAGDRIAQFAPSGLIFKMVELEGVENASGLAIDQNAGRVYVTDIESPRVLVFELGDI